MIWDIAVYSKSRFLLFQDVAKIDFFSCTILRDEFTYIFFTVNWAHILSLFEKNSDQLGELKNTIKMKNVSLNKKNCAKQTY